MLSPISAAKFQQLKEAFNTLAKQMGKEKINNDKAQELLMDEPKPEKDRLCNQHSSSSSSSAGACLPVQHQ
jgi:hypothetical protein